jgi:hypothetical protein
MADVVNAGDRCIHRGILGVTLDGSGLLAQPPIIGFVNKVDTDAADILWDNGQVSSGVPVDASDPGSCPVLKLSSSFNSLYGKVVQRIDASSEFIGIVLWVASVQLDPGAVETAQIFCVKSTGPSQAFWVALATQCEQVEGR